MRAQPLPQRSYRRRCVHRDAMLTTRRNASNFVGLPAFVDKPLKRLSSGIQELFACIGGQRVFPEGDRFRNVAALAPDRPRSFLNPIRPAEIAAGMETHGNRRITRLLQFGYSNVNIVQNRDWFSGDEVPWPERDLDAMKMPVRISFLLIACLCMPRHLSAQSAENRYSVSVRELSIPAKARHAFDAGVTRFDKKDAAGSLANFQRAVLEYPGYYEAYDMIGRADLQIWRFGRRAGLS